MKRAIYILIILLADITILAHTVVPHHHHNKILVAVVNLFDDTASHDTPHGHSNCPYDEKSAEKCPISEAIASIVFQIQKDDNTDLSPLKLDKGNSGLYSFIANININTSNHGFLQSIPLTLKPYIERYYLCNVTRYEGLRAPPVC